MWNSFISFVVVTSAVLLPRSRGDEVEYRLTRYLLANYDAAVRPSVNFTQPVRVTLNFSLTHLIDVDIREQVITTNCWLIQKWNDAHLRWNSSDFGGISEVFIPAHILWKPDIILINSAYSQNNAAPLGPNALVESTGDVTWRSQGMYRSSCHLDPFLYPFDSHSCVLHFAPWTYPAPQVEVLSGEVDLDRLHPNSEFGLSLWADRVPGRFELRLERACPGWALATLLGPCLLLNALAVAALAVPPESRERLSTSLAGLLAAVLLLEAGRNAAPAAHRTPLIALYSGLTVALLGASTLCSIMSLHLQYSTKPLAGCARSFLLSCLGRLLACEEPLPPVSTKENSSRSGSGGLFPRTSDKSAELDHIEHYSFSPRLRHRAPSGASELGGGGDEFERHFLTMLNRVYDAMERHETRAGTRERAEQRQAEWSRASRFCDRLFGLLLILAAVASTLGCVALAQR